MMALRDIKQHPGKLGLGRAWFGVGMGAFFTILLLLAGIVWSVNLVT